MIPGTAGLANAAVRTSPNDLPSPLLAALIALAAMGGIAWGLVMRTAGRRRAVSRYASFAASALIGAALCAIAFAGGSGFELASVTWVEIGAVAGGGALVALAILRGRGGRIDGGFTLIAFGGLALLCALSILWSVAPERTWESANLTVAYVALFAGGMAIARLRADGVVVVLRGILLAAGIVVVYALITRVFPSLARDEVFARLGQPYGYWNALGTTAALAVPAALWLGSRRSGHQPVNALAYPLLSLLLVALFLSYSRGALIMAGIGAALWVAFVPLRLRSITLLGVSLAGAAPVIVWALGQDAFTKNEVSLPVREAVATEFGLWLLATVIVMLGAGLAIGFRVARRPPRATARLRMGTAATVVAIVVPIVLSVVLANSDRGLGGTITQGYESLTSISKKTPGGPSRLLSASSARGLYWHQAKEVFLDHYWKGSGAETFGVTRLRYRPPTDRTVPQHAHGYLQQTAADLGIAGLLVSFTLLFAWLVSARQLHRRPSPPPQATGRFQPGPGGADRARAVRARVRHALAGGLGLVRAGAGGDGCGRGRIRGGARPTGPLSRRPWQRAHPELAAAAGASPPEPSNGHGARVPGEGRPAAVHQRPPTPEPVPSAAGTAAASATLSPPVAEGGAGERMAAGSGGDETAVLPPLSELPPPAPPAPPPAPPPARRRFVGFARPALATLTLGVAVLCAWAIWQPLRSDHESDRALDLAANNHLAAARHAAERAHQIDPLSPRPYVVRNAVEDAAGNPAAAQKVLEAAVLAFPADPQTWIQLAQYQLNSRNRPAEALKTVVGALYTRSESRAAQTVYFQADTALNTQGAAATPSHPRPSRACRQSRPSCHAQPRKRWHHRPHSPARRPTRAHSVTAAAPGTRTGRRTAA